MPEQGPRPAFQVPKGSRHAEEAFERARIRISELPDGGVSIVIFATGRESRKSGKPALKPSVEPELPPPAPIKSVPTSEKDKRVTLIGRAARDPVFRENGDGKAVARFPLATRGDNDKTVYHSVVAFGERARKVSERVKKGELVEVVGYEKIKQVPTRDGGSRIQRDIFVARVSAKAQE